jgi:trk system potassium uptake protein TrkH
MNSGINIKLIARILGSLLMVESMFILLTTIVALYYGETDWQYFVVVGLVAAAVGGLGALWGKNASKQMGRREGSLIVTFIWILFSLVGLMPFWISGAIPSFVNAFFETMSGFTSTGATIMENIEQTSRSMLFWRAMTHWIGGLGIVVISLALLPMFGFSAMQLFSSESTGPTKDKLHPKIAETAKRLMLIYLILTVTLVLLLRVGGMGWFDSVCHSFSTIATGGFSTKQSSLAYWDSAYIHYVITIFMVLSGVNFSLYYYAFVGKFEKVRENEELRYYLLILVTFSLIIFFSLIDITEFITLRTTEENIRTAVFQISSIMTTTGFSTVDYMFWKPLTWVVIIMIMLIGGSAGSTSGGIKVVRIVIVFKYCYYEFKRMVHPNAVIPVMYNRSALKNDVVTRTLAFVLLYILLVFFGVFVLCVSGMGIMESIGGMITCLSTVGHGFGMVSPSGTFAEIPEFSKWFLSFVMLIGRLELFTVLILFTPVFWRK